MLPTSLDLDSAQKSKSDGGVMVGEFVCVYVCACTGERVSE